MPIHTPGCALLVCVQDRPRAIKNSVQGHPGTDSNVWVAETQFVAALAGLPAIKIKESFDRAIAKVDAGVNLFDLGGRMQIQANYGGAFGQSPSEQTVKADFL
jgi:hypothetical protein